MKINTKNKAKVEAQLELIQHRSTARTINYEDIAEMVWSIEKKLRKILPKKEWKGLSFLYDFNAQRFPASYKQTPMSTIITLLRGSTEWFITSIQRWECHAPSGQIVPQNLHIKHFQILDFVCDSKNWSD